jgi:hypothetical protein
METVEAFEEPPTTLQPLTSPRLIQPQLTSQLASLPQRFLDMSFRRSLAQLPRLAPRALPTAARVALPSTRLAVSTAPRLFSTSPPTFRTAVDSKWSEGKDVSYEELKPITQNPSDVRL